MLVLFVLETLKSSHYAVLYFLQNFVLHKDPL